MGLFHTRQRPPRLQRHPQLRLIFSSIFGIGVNPIEGKFINGPSMAMEEFTRGFYIPIIFMPIIFITKIFNTSSDDFKDGTGFKAWFSLIQLVILLPFCQFFFTLHLTTRSSVASSKPPWNCHPWRQMPKKTHWWSSGETSSEKKKNVFFSHLEWIFHFPSIKMVISRCLMTPRGLRTNDDWLRAREKVCW